MTGVLVVGNGPAAHRLVQRLHHHGHPGPVTVLGAEPRPAYNRALLTAVLDGTLPPEGLALPELPAGTRVRTGTRATSIDRRRRLVRTEDGAAHPYDVLVLATGSRPVVPRLARGGGRFAPDVRYPHTLGDARPLGREPVVVAGGGLRGVETGHALARAGHDVTLVHPGPHPLHRLLDARAGTLLAVALRDAGLALETGRRVVGTEPGKVLLDDGSPLAAGTLLLCTGSRPDTALARAAGLTARRGVAVDDLLRTSAPHVYALGDCAEPPGPGAHGTLASAWDQADALARTLTGTTGAPGPARRAVRPRLTGIDLAVVGPPDDPDGTGSAGDERVELSDPARGRYGRLLFRDGRIRAAVLLGLPRAASAVGLLYAEDRPAPADRLALLLGATEEYAGGAELPDTAVVCQCNNVTRGTLLRAWRDGARDLPALAAATRATTGCGSCAALVRGICEKAAEASREAAP
ncbi:FAD-dependent oxidoreductase [Streptomyces sp. NPDC005828]|uniref:FAD-dependent oxidoreductase n=1 Tax=Streptomyces sp. NPDC005828 TaxID=3157071 RepID=UPI00340774FC